MKNRDGFTLAELILSVFIFSFIAASLATIVSTTNRHMFQNYRKNIIKTNVLLSMKAIQKNLSVATRVDLPTRNNSINDSGKFLAFATNVDETRGGAPGCYPIVAGVQPAWHYFCHYTQVNQSCLSGSCLFYHTGPINGGGVACGNPGAATWNAVYPVGTCGPTGSGTIMLLMDNVSFDSPPSLPAGALFSRRSSDGINSADTVRVVLHSKWRASVAGMGASQRDVDATLDTVVKFNRSYP